MLESTWLSIGFWPAVGQPAGRDTAFGTFGTRPGPTADREAWAAAVGESGSAISGGSCAAAMPVPTASRPTASMAGRRRGDDVTALRLLGGNRGAGL